MHNVIDRVIGDKLLYEQYMFIYDQINMITKSSLSEELEVYKKKEFIEYCVPKYIFYQSMCHSAKVLHKMIENSRKDGGHFEITDYYQPTKHVLDSEDNIVFGYTDNEYLSPDLVLNLLTNGESFTSTTGWTREGTDLIYADFFPRLVNTEGEDLTGADLITELANSKLTLRTAAQLDSLICNSGLIDNRRKFLNIGIAKDERYVVRFKAYFDQNQQQGISDPTLFSCFIAPYDNLTNNKFSNIGSHLFDFSFNASNYDSESNYVIGTASAQYALTYEDLLNKKIGFFI